MTKNLLKNILKHCWWQQSTNLLHGIQLYIPLTDRSSSERDITVPSVLSKKKKKITRLAHVYNLNLPICAHLSNRGHQYGRHSAQSQYQAFLSSINKAMELSKTDLTANFPITTTTYCNLRKVHHGILPADFCHSSTAFQSSLYSDNFQWTEIKNISLLHYLPF